MLALLRHGNLATRSVGVGEVKRNLASLSIQPPVLVNAALADCTPAARQDLTVLAQSSMIPDAEPRADRCEKRALSADRIRLGSRG